MSQEWTVDHMALRGLVAAWDFLTRRDESCRTYIPLIAVAWQIVVVLFCLAGDQALNVSVTPDAAAILPGVFLALGGAVVAGLCMLAGRALAWTGRSNAGAILCSLATIISAYLVLDLFVLTYDVALCAAENGPGPGNTSLCSQQAGSVLGVAVLCEILAALFALAAALRISAKMALSTGGFAVAVGCAVIVVHVMYPR